MGLGLRTLCRLPPTILVGCVLVWGVAGVLCGFAALKPQLLRAHVYAELCTSPHNGTTAMVECDEQMLRIDRMYALGIVGATVPCALGGLAIDRLGARVVGLVSALAYGSAVCALGRSTAQHDVYVPAFMMVGAAGGVFHMNVVVTLQRRFPAHLEVLTNLLTTTWDLSALVPVLLALAIERWRLSLHTLLCAYGAALGLAMAAFTLATVPRGVAARASAAIKAKSDDESDAKAAPATGAPPLWRVLCSRRVASLCAALSCNCMQGFLFLGTVDEQLSTVFLPQQTRALLDAFSLMLPLLAFPNAALFHLLGTRASLPARWLLLGLSNAAWAACAVTPVAPLQYAAFLIYTFWRMLTWVVFFATVGHCFPRDAGTVAGVAQSVTGVVLLAQEPLRAAALRLFPANFVPLQLGLTLVATTSSVLCAAAFWPLRHEPRATGAPAAPPAARTRSEAAWTRFRLIGAPHADGGERGAATTCGAGSGGGGRVVEWDDDDDDGGDGDGDEDDDLEKRPLLASSSLHYLPT